MAVSKSAVKAAKKHLSDDNKDAKHEIKEHKELVKKLSKPAKKGKKK